MKTSNFTLKKKPKLVKVVAIKPIGPGMRKLASESPPYHFLAVWL